VVRCHVMAPAGRPSLLPACIVAAFCSLVAAIYGASATVPGPGMAFLLTLLPLTAVCLWLQGDARRLRAGYLLDLGFLLWVFWPLVIPWHALSTRGRRGWGLALGLLGLVLAPSVSAALAAALMSAMATGRAMPAP